MNELVYLLGVIAIGLLLGRIALYGISLGTSAILFVALVAGHWGVESLQGLGDLGLAIFVFSVGLSAGPTFFRGMASRGRTMAAIGALIVLTGLFTSMACGWLLKLSPELTGGLMAGAMTSTPALGAITQSVQDSSSVAVGFGVAYPIGIISVVLFVQLALKTSRPTTTSRETNEESDRIERRVIEVINPAIFGKGPSEIESISRFACQISRLNVDSRWRPLPIDYRFASGHQLLLVGRDADIAGMAATLGRLIENAGVVLDADRERKTVVVTSPNIYGHSLGELHLRSTYGVTVARVRRSELEFVPSGQTVIEFGDTLTLVGEPDALASIEDVVGHRPRTLNESDLFSLACGLAVGLIVGRIKIELDRFSLSLGLAGGPLIVGLILGHFRRIGPLRGSFPPAAQLLMTEGGLALFLVDAGLKAGKDIGPVFAQHGIGLCISAALIATLPMLVGYAVGRFGYYLDLPQNLGATCGGMTSTPGLAVLTAANDSSQCITCYVAAYPVALVLMTILAPLLVGIMKSIQ